MTKNNHYIRKNHQSHHTHNNINYAINSTSKSPSEIHEQKLFMIKLVCHEKILFIPLNTTAISTSITTTKAITITTFTALKSLYLTPSLPIPVTSLVLLPEPLSTHGKRSADKRLTRGGRDGEIILGDGLRRSILVGC